MNQKIIVCADDGKPLNAPSPISAEQAAAIDRNADLLMAHQWGREAACDPAQAHAFSTQFGNDPEARQHFDAGMASVQQ